MLQEQDKQLIKGAIKEALFEAGLAKDMVNQYQASKMLSRRHIENGIKSGDLRLISSGTKSYMIKVDEIIKYQRTLMEAGKIRLKTNHSNG